MLRLVALLLLTACSAAPTSLKITLYSSGGINPPEAFAVSIWDPHGPLVLGKVVRGEVPGTLFIINLPDVDQVLRVGFADADTGAPLIAARIPVRAHEETDAVLHVDGTTDSDNDDVPDPIDNCPDDPNREQRDADGDGVGDNCAGRDFGVIADLTGFDLAGADLARPPCNALFCDGFDDNLVTSTYLTSPGGTLRWDKLDGDPQHTFTEIDFLPGALASPRSLRFRLQGDAPGGMVADYQRYGVGIGLHSGIPNWTKLLNGPTYMRFYVKLSDPPQVQHGGEVSMAYVWWGNESNNLELRATNSGVSLNVRFPFGTFTRDTTPQAVGWVGGFVCVEWKHESVPDADAGLVYRSVVWVNDVEAATFEGTGVPAVFSGFILGADVEFRPDIPAFTHFTEWFDEVKFSDQKIGCN